MADASPNPGLAAPAGHAKAITPSDTVDLADAARAIYVGTAGDIRLLTPGGETVTFANVPVGLLPVRATRVFSTLTSADNLISLW